MEAHMDFVISGLCLVALSGSPLNLHNHIQWSQQDSLDRHPSHRKIHSGPGLHSTLDLGFAQSIEDSCLGIATWTSYFALHAIASVVQKLILDDG